MRSAMAAATGCGAVRGDLGDRGGIRFQAEQARANLVMQFQCRAAPFIVLCADQAAIERQVFGSRAT